MTTTVRPEVVERSLRSRPLPSIAPVRRRTVLARPVVHRFLACQMIGQTADAATTLTLAVVLVAALEPGAAPGALAGALLAAAVPFALAPLAGVLADRWDRRTTLARVHAVRAAVVLLAVLVPLTGSRPAGFVLAAVLLGVSRVVYALRSAALPHLVAPRELVALDSLALLASMASGAIGAGMALLLAHDAPAAVLVVAAAGQLAAGAGFGRLSADLGGGRRDLAPQRLRDTVRHVTDVLVARPNGVALALTVGHRALVGAVFATFVVLVDARYELGASGYGAAVALTGVGALVGTLTAPAAAMRWRRSTVSVGSYLVASVAVASMAASLALPVVVAGALLVVSFAFQNLRLVADATVQSSVADDALGRVFALYDAGYNLAFVAGGLTTLALVVHATHSELLVAVACTYAAAGALHALDVRRTPW